MTLPSNALVLAGLLRELRKSHAVSQLDLALRLDVSQRHLSYVELGRARPSRQLLVAWLDELKAPQSLRSAALLHGGFAGAARGDPPHDDPAALQLARTLLAAHAPWPAICVGADWRLLLANPARRALNRIIMPDLAKPLQAAGEGSDMIDMLIQPGGLLSTVRDGAAIGWDVLQQLRAEAWAQPALRERVDAFESRLRALHPRPVGRSLRAANTTEFRLVFDTAQGALSFHAVQLVAGLPQNVTLASPRVALWYPVDERTRQVLRQLP